MPKFRFFPSAKKISVWLDRELRVHAVQDSAVNGLQFESRRPVRKVAAAVDASLASFDAAARAGADLLLVHHGLFWGEAPVMDPLLRQRVRRLVDYGLSLYASHLPLDLHPRRGNNALLAQAVGLARLTRFGEYHGQRIGFIGSWPRPATRPQAAARLRRATAARVRVWPFGPERIRRAAVVSGGAGDLALEAAAAGCDAFLTGEITHQHYHLCREAGINVFIGGHYATETFGVQSLLKWVGETFGVGTEFLDIPTGL